MVIFHSYVKLPEGNTWDLCHGSSSSHEMHPTYPNTSSAMVCGSCSALGAIFAWALDHTISFVGSWIICSVKNPSFWGDMGWYGSSTSRPENVIVITSHLETEVKSKCFSNLSGIFWSNLSHGWCFLPQWAHAAILPPRCCHSPNHSENPCETRPKLWTVDDFHQPFGFLWSQNWDEHVPTFPNHFLGFKGFSNRPCGTSAPPTESPPAPRRWSLPEASTKTWVSLHAMFTTHLFGNGEHSINYLYGDFFGDGLWFKLLLYPHDSISREVIPVIQGYTTDMCTPGQSHGPKVEMIIHWIKLSRFHACIFSCKRERTKRDLVAFGLGFAHQNKTVLREYWELIIIMI